MPDGEAELLWGLGLLRDLLEIFLVIKTAPHERVVNVPDLLDGPYHGLGIWAYLIGLDLGILRL